VLDVRADRLLPVLDQVGVQPRPQHRHLQERQLQPLE